MSASCQLVDWKAVQGAFHKPRRLHLKCRKDELFHCPLPNCEHEGFASQRGCRKHVKTKHPWYIYFHTKPKISNDDEKNADVKELSSSGSKPTLPCCNVNSDDRFRLGFKVQPVVERKRSKPNSQ